MHLYNRGIVGIIVSLLSWLVLLTGCDNRTPIKIGFVGGLTGRHADLGLYGRNGVLLAIEEVNASGGINGRELELIVKDDKQDPSIAVRVDKELIAEDVVAIIGHFTSAMSVAAVPVVNSEEILLLSPTTSTNYLSGKDDQFLRIMSPNLQANTRLAKHVFEEKKIRKLVVAYDDQNRAFGKDWADFFEQLGKESGREVIVYPYVSKDGFHFSDLAEKIVSNKPDGTLIVAAALDAAMLCQQIRKTGSDMPLFTTMWSMSNDFLQHGGAAAEGVAFANWFDPDHPSATSKEFRKKYSERFGQMPTFASHFSYEAASVLIYALNKTQEPQALKTAILDKKSFHGTQGIFTFDQYGDAQRDLFIMQVENGKFVNME